jgi:serine/threonine-protein kinase
MTNQGQDEAFAKYVLHTGVVRIEHLETAREEQERSGQSISEILVALGAITPLQRQDIEKRVAAGMGETPPQLGSYRLLCKLGEGGMGAVYLCEDTMLNRQVALKILPKDVTESPELLSRFRREAVAAGKLNHAGIAAAFAVGEEAGLHYYAMEYCRGESLDKLLKRLKRLPEKKIVEVALAAARAMQHAHDHGILHRDLKPGNIMLGLDGSVKVLDMGLSKNVTDQEESFQTTSGLAIGTPHYISPEQARGDKVVDGRADIYSLGATMYHLATGQTPYAGSTAAVIMTRHLNDPVPDPRALNPELSDAFSRVVRVAMAKGPAHRYASMNDFAADLERLLAGQAVRATPVRRPAGVRRRSQPVLVWGGLLFAAITVGIGVFLYRFGGASPSGAPDPVDVLPPKPQPPLPEQQAQTAFASLFDGLAADDRLGRIARLESFLKVHGATRVGAQAQALLEELKRSAAVAADAARWRPLFDGQSIDCLVEPNQGHWLVEGQRLVNVEGSTDCAQTRRVFADGEVRIRFSVSEAAYLQFTMRQGREGGYGVVFDRHALAQVQGDCELVFTCRGTKVTATLDGKPQAVKTHGTPLTGRLQFGVLEGRLRIAAIEFAE